MNMSFSEIYTLPNEWDEVKDVQSETVAEQEAMESYSLHGFRYLLTHNRVRAFSAWWAKYGRFMTRPLDLNITQ